MDFLQIISKKVLSSWANQASVGKCICGSVHGIKLNNQSKLWRKEHAWVASTPIFLPTDQGCPASRPWACIDQQRQSHLYCDPAVGCNHYIVFVLWFQTTTVSLYSIKIPHNTKYLQISFTLNIKPFSRGIPKNLSEEYRPQAGAAGCSALLKIRPLP